MKYKILDRQIAGREFADGAIFDSKEDVLKQLTSYHQQDSEEPEAIGNMTLEELLEFGGWILEEVR